MAARLTDKEVLMEVAKATKALTLWAQQGLKRERVVRAGRYLFQHYSLFVMLRETMVKDGLSFEEAKEASDLAGSPDDIMALFVK